MTTTSNGTEMGDGNLPPDPPGLSPTDFGHLVGTEEYYQARHDDFLRRQPKGSPPDYYLQYGLKYFRRFAELKVRLSIAGQEWVERTKRLLQEKIESRRAADPVDFALLENDHDGFRQFAYATHPHAYVEGGLAGLDPDDIVLIVEAPDRKDVLTHDGVQQIVTTAVATLLEQGVTGSSMFALYAAESLERHFQQQAVNIFHTSAQTFGQRITMSMQTWDDGVTRMGRTLGNMLVPSWTMRQDWRTLLFCSWRVPATAIADLIPSGLEPDLYDGSAWVSMVPLEMAAVGFVSPRLVALPPFFQVNLRTYVRNGDERGVFFLSLDCGDAAANLGAQLFFDLPYRRAHVTVEQSGEWFRCKSERTFAPHAKLGCRYRPTGALRLAGAGSLEEFLTERYFLFIESPLTGLRRGEVKHRPWTIQGAELIIDENTVPAAAGLSITGHPDHVCFSPGVSTEALPFEDA